MLKHRFSVGLGLVALCVVQQQPGVAQACSAASADFAVLSPRWQQPAPLNVQPLVRLDNAVALGVFDDEDNPLPFEAEQLGLGQLADDDTDLNFQHPVYSVAIQSQLDPNREYRLVAVLETDWKANQARAAQEDSGPVQLTQAYLDAFSDEAGRDAGASGGDAGEEAGDAGEPKSAFEQRLLAAIPGSELAVVIRSFRTNAAEDRDAPAAPEAGWVSYNFDSASCGSTCESDEQICIAGLEQQPLVLAQLTFEADGTQSIETLLVDHVMRYMPQAFTARTLVSASLISLDAAGNRSAAVHLNQSQIAHGVGPADCRHKPETPAPDDANTGSDSSDVKAMDNDDKPTDDSSDDGCSTARVGATSAATPWAMLALLGAAVIGRRSRRA